MVLTFLASFNSIATTPEEDNTYITFEDKAYMETLTTSQSDGLNTRGL